jgi:NAD(P)-dependent dehydrogenase (short-subunit alcohol dehydrogenase family)
VTVVITGVSPDGIGSATAAAIASQGPAKLVLASRTRKNLEAVGVDIKLAYGNVPVELVTMDLSSVKSIGDAAAEISSMIDKLDVLINNAGLTLQTRTLIMAPDDTTVDLQLFTNHIGPFLLTELLLPKLLASGSHSETGWPRVVNLSSHGHRLSPIRFSDYAFQLDLYQGVPEDERPPSAIAPGFLEMTDGYPGFIAYGQSKTANILHTVELNNRFQRSGKSVLALSVHPGTINTGLSRSWDESGRATLGGTAPGGVWKSTDQGAATTIVAAFVPMLRKSDEKPSETNCWYLADCQLADEKLASHAKDPRSATRLWDETERMLKMTSKLV